MCVCMCRCHSCCSFSLGGPEHYMNCIISIKVEHLASSRHMGASRHSGSKQQRPHALILWAAPGRAQHTIIHHHLRGRRVYCLQHLWYQSLSSPRPVVVSSANCIFSRRVHMRILMHACTGGVCCTSETRRRSRFLRFFNFLDKL